MYSRNLSVFLICLIVLLERASNYGMRAALVLYATAATGLEMATEDLVQYFGYFAIAVALIQLPLGVITDFFLKQKKAITIGGGLSFLGALLLISGQSIAITTGLVLITIGGGLLKPNLNVLLGRLYSKQEQQRDAAFMLRNIFVNIGAFLGALALGYIVQTWGYSYAFSTTAAVALTYWVIFLIIRNKIEEREENLISAKNTVNDESILDEHTSTVTTNTSSFYLILLTILLMVLYGEGYNLILNTYDNAMEGINSIIILGYERPALSMQSIVLPFAILAGIPLTIVWHKRAKGSSIKRLAVGFLLITGALSIGYWAMHSLSEQDMPNIASSLLVLYLAEMLIPAVAVSYVTRLSDVRYSSTIIGAYIALISAGGIALGKVKEAFGGEIPLLYSILISLAITGLLLAFRKDIGKLSNGIT